MNTSDHFARQDSGLTEQKKNLTYLKINVHSAKGKYLSVNIQLLTPDTLAGTKNNWESPQEIKQVVNWVLITALIIYAILMFQAIDA